MLHPSNRATGLHQSWTGRLKTKSRELARQLSHTFLNKDIIKTRRSHDGDAEGRTGSQAASQSAAHRNTRHSNSLSANEALSTASIDKSHTPQYTPSKTRLAQDTTDQQIHQVPNITDVNGQVVHGGDDGTACQHSESKRPTAIDRKYVVNVVPMVHRPIAQRIGSMNDVMATLSEDKASVYPSQIPNPGTDELEASTGDASCLDGVFRRVHILFDNDPENKQATVQYVMHDTGAGGSLTFAGKLAALGMEFMPINNIPPFVSVTGEKFKPIGTRQIRFSYKDKGDKYYWAFLYVLPDPENEMEPSFDILFGRDVIRATKAISWDLGVIGKEP